ncbi:hypothetical protein B0H11DRAFT_1974986 [Mycena galericulata]|nr:hypothetical protein B0H11DRAFT_1974986 [Mycena galericulata]
MDCLVRISRSLAVRLWPWCEAGGGKAAVPVHQRRELPLVPLLYLYPDSIRALARRLFLLLLLPLSALGWTHADASFSMTRCACCLPSPSALSLSFSFAERFHTFFPRPLTPAPVPHSIPSLPSVLFVLLLPHFSVRLLPPSLANPFRASHRTPLSLAPPSYVHASRPASASSPSHPNPHSLFTMPRLLARYRSSLFRCHRSVPSCFPSPAPASHPFLLHPLAPPRVLTLPVFSFSCHLPPSPPLHLSPQLTPHPPETSSSTSPSPSSTPTRSSRRSTRARASPPPVPPPRTAARAAASRTRPTTTPTGGAPALAHGIPTRPRARGRVRRA